jgi:hypothetical protein
MISTARWLGASLLLLSSGAVGCGGLKDDRPVTWSFIYATIIQPQCATVNCHSAIAKKDGFDLSERDVAYCSGAQLLPVILRGDVKELMLKRMPIDAPLPAADIELIEAWAAAGSVNDAFADGGSCTSKKAGVDAPAP